MYYDLVFDPNETHNLTSDPPVTEVLNEMRGRLDRWMQAAETIHCCVGRFPSLSVPK